MGQTLTAEIGKTGSYAASKTHEGVLELYQDADKRLVADTINKIAKIYTKVNSATAFAPKFVWFEEEDPNSDFANRDKTLSETGVKFTKKYFINKYRLNEDDFDIAEETAKQGVLKANKGDFTAYEGDSIKKAENADFDANSVQEDKNIEKAQNDLDEMISDLDIEPELSGVIKKIILQSKSFEDIQEEIAKLDLYDDEFDKLVQQALFAADMWGRFNA